MKAAAEKGFLRRLRLLPVPFHYLRPAEADFTLLADRQHHSAGLQVDYFQNGLRRRQSDAALPCRSVRYL
jgi:hypothetical protein